MGKPTFDLCYSEEAMRRTPGRGTRGLAGSGWPSGRGASPGPEIFGLAEINRRDLLPESIGEQERTRGTETSQYPEERTSNETPLVVASERGPGRALKQREPAGNLGHSG